MARRPARPCRHPGCSELTREGWCPKHKPKDTHSTMEMWKLREQAKQLAEVIYGEIVYKYH